MKKITANELLSMDVVSIAPLLSPKGDRIVAIVDSTGFMEGAYTLFVLKKTHSLFSKKFLVLSSVRFPDAENMDIAAKEYFRLTGQKLPKNQLDRIAINMPL